MKIIKIFFISFFFVSCATTMYENDLNFDLVENFIKKNQKSDLILISIDQQKLFFKTRFRTISFSISSSAFGIGNKMNSFQTPLGEHIVAEKIGEDLPLGAVLKGRKWTKEVVVPIKDVIDIPEDVITSRILWLDGVEQGINKGGDVDY